MSVDSAFRRLREANPVPDPALLREPDLDVAVLLTATQQRSTAMDTKEPITIEPRRKPPRRNWILVAVAAAAILLVGLVVLMSSQNDAPIADEPEVPTTAAGVEEPETPEVAIITEEAALATANSYIEAFNTGDDAAVLALLTQDVTISDSFLGAWDPVEWQSLLAWNTAQGTNHRNVLCTSAPGGDEAMAVECRTNNSDILVQTANDVPVPTVLNMTVIEEGISNLNFQYGVPDFNRVSSAFVAYLAVAHPEYEDGWSDSPEDSRQAGQLRAQYAREWIDSATGSVEAAMADYNAGDLPAFLGRFADTAIIVDIAPQDVGTVMPTVMAANDRMTITGCAPEGVNGSTLEIGCDIVIQDDFDGAAGVQLAGRTVFLVSGDGTIVNTDSTLDYTDVIAFSQAFVTWMAETHSDIYAGMDWLDGDVPYPTVDHMPTALQLVDEFVAESEVYPLGG